MKKPNQNFLNTQLNKNWTLFLDRDGVINERLIGDYVKSVEEFTFCKGAVEAIATFTKIFGKIIVITNQQGIGKSIMSEMDLLTIHQYMSAEIKKHGGFVNDIFYCPVTNLTTDSYHRASNFQTKDVSLSNLDRSQLSHNPRSKYLRI